MSEFVIWLMIIGSLYGAILFITDFIKFIVKIVKGGEKE